MLKTGNLENCCEMNARNAPPLRVRTAGTSANGGDANGGDGLIVLL